MSDLIKDLREANITRAFEFHKNSIPVRDTEELLFRSNELGGEVGELQNKVKKLCRHLRGMVGGVNRVESIEAIGKEAADVIICVDRILEFFDIDTEEVIRAKFNETSIKNDLKTMLTVEKRGRRIRSKGNDSQYYLYKAGDEGCVIDVTPGINDKGDLLRVSFDNGKSAYIYETDTVKVSE